MERIIRYFNDYIDINFENKHAVRNLIRAVFIIYVSFVLYKLLLGNERIFGQGIISANRDSFNNIIPFHTIILYFKHFSYFTLWNWVLNIFGNILVFIPFGMLFPFAFKIKHKFLGCIFSGFMLSAVIENIQRVTALGVFDVDDTILNTVGVLIGYGIYKVIYVVSLKMK